MTIWSKLGISKPNFFAFIVHGLLVLLVPRSYKDASKVPKWKYAMQLEYEYLLQIGTWELVSLHVSKQVICCKWMFRVKLKVDKTLNRYKAWVVAKGFIQIEGVDFWKPYLMLINQPLSRSFLYRLFLKVGC